MIEDVLVIIDPGHGGRETGAVANGYIEKDLNLVYATKLANELKKYIKNVRMTRTDDITLDLAPRGIWVAEQAASFPGKTICISCHFNAFNGKARGGETIHSIHADPKLATLIYRSMLELGMPGRRVFTRESTKHPGNDYYAMHSRTGKAETVIVEPLFLDNNEDVKFLKKPGFLDVLAEKIALGIYAYLDISPEVSFEDALSILHGKGIINTPEYWKNNAVEGGSIKGEYARLLIESIAAKLK